MALLLLIPKFQLFFQWVCQVPNTCLTAFDLLTSYQCHKRQHFNKVLLTISILPSQPFHRKMGEVEFDLIPYRYQEEVFQRAKKGVSDTSF